MNEVQAMSVNESKPPEVGDFAPDFALPSTCGETVRLMSLANNPIVLFFLTDTFTFFSRGFSDLFEGIHESLSMMEVTVIGVSTEPVETLCTFAEDERVPYLLLSDFDRQVSIAYGTLAERIGALTMVTRAGVFVIDRKGRIVYRWIHDEDCEVPDIQKIVELISRLDN